MLTFEQKLGEGKCWNFLFTKMGWFALKITIILYFVLKIYQYDTSQISESRLSFAEEISDDCESFVAIFACQKVEKQDEVYFQMLIHTIKIIF